MATATVPDSVRDPLVGPIPAGLTRSGAVRLDAIDMLRGLVIAIMVLDHVRDFFHAAGSVVDPTDPRTSYPLLYATRWITHLCAPTFVFLAGVSILFQKANGKPPADLSRFLLSRGLWLILLECTIISFGFNFAEPFVFLQVIWAIGVGMICMAALSRLSAPVVLGIGVAILALYPLVVPATAGADGVLGVVRTVTIAPGIIPGTPILAFYSVVPWLGVLCLGFGIGPLFRRPAAERDARILVLGIALLTAFVLLRLWNGYGDPRPWAIEPTITQSVMSFLNISKYPPSPDYVCATLGVSMLLFLALERLRGPVARVLLDFGRTPLFTYLAHLYIAHGLMLVLAIAAGVPAAAIDVLGTAFAGGTPPPFGYPLSIVYLIWLLVLAMLVPLSRWFAGVKRRRRDWWLSYL